MLTSVLKHKVVRTAALGATAALTLPLLTSPASADPRQHTNQLVTVGSDTTQEVMNAFAGEASGVYFDPLASDAATKRTQISSWNAVPPVGPDGNTISCIVPRAGKNAIQRPNGSTNGRAALSRRFDGQPFNMKDGDPACDGKPTGGIVDFARSSSGPASGDTGTTLTYVPFGRGALTYAYYAVNGATPDTALTKVELETIFKDTGNGTTVDGLLVIPCSIQLGSGTRKDWVGKLSGVTEGGMDTAGTTCRNANGASAPAGDNLQEHRTNELKSKADAWVAAGNTTPAMWIVGHGVDTFLAQKNGAAPDNTGAGADLGHIGGVAPYNIVIGEYRANSPFYTGHFGRLLYNVFLTGEIGSPGTVSFGAMKQLFRGSTSKVCTATNTLDDFGYLQLPAGDENTAGNCGSIATKGSLIADTI